VGNDRGGLPHLLVVLGADGPSPEPVVAAAAGRARLSWLVTGGEPAAVARPLRATGRVLAATDESAAIAAAGDLHDVDRFTGVVALAADAVPLAGALGRALDVAVNPVAVMRSLSATVTAADGGVPLSAYRARPCPGTSGAEPAAAIDRAELLSRIEAWAADRSDVLAVVLIGSLGRPAAAVDELSDIDLELVVEDVAGMAADDSWWRGFGEVWLARVIAPYTAAPTQRYPMLNLVYAGGVGLDVVLVDRFRLTEMVEAGELDRVYAPGFRVLLDREGVTRALPRPSSASPATLRISSGEFTTAVEAFWFEALSTAKYLRRAELWEARTHDHTMKTLLLRMLEWHCVAFGGRGFDGNPHGRRLRDRIDERTWHEVLRTHGRLDAADSWRALTTTVDLFDRLGRETARAVDLPYPGRTVTEVRAHLAHLAPAERS
jgi:aminoglycoside 6-adenylyltransferase